MSNETEFTTPVEQGPLTQHELSGKSNVDIAGMKNVSLGVGPSQEIRARLMQMIQEREAKRGGWGDFIDTMTAVSGDPTNFAADWNNYQKRKSERDQELMQMYAGVGQLDTERERIALLRAQEAARLQRNNDLFGGAPSNSPLIAQNQQENIMASRLRQLPREVQIGIKSLLDSPNPQIQAQGYTQLIAATKPTDLERNIGLTGATGTRAQALALGNILPNAGTLTQTTIPGDPSGATRNTTGLAALEQVFGGPNPFGGPTQAPNTTPAPTGGLSTVAPAQAQEPTTPAAVPPVSTARPLPPAPTATKPAPKSALEESRAMENPKNPFHYSKVPNKAPVGSIEWNKAEEERMKNYAKYEADVAGVDIEAKKAEAKKRGERIDAQVEAVETAGQESGNQMLAADKMISDLRYAKPLVGKLAKFGAGSAFLTALSNGVKAGNLGSVGFPAIGEIQAQLSNDPEIKKLPKAEQDKTIAAYYDLMRSLKQQALDYTRKVMDKQGPVSEGERQLVAEAIGTIDKLTPKQIYLMAIANKTAAMNARDLNKEWSRARKTMSWEDFRNTPRYAAIKEAHFKRMANAMKSVPEGL